MKVTLSHTDVIEACKLWLATRHGITLADKASIAMGGNIEGTRAAVIITQIAIEFGDAQGSPPAEGRSYREPG